MGGFFIECRFDAKTFLSFDKVRYSRTNLKPAVIMLERKVVFRLY